MMGCYGVTGSSMLAK